MAEDAAFLGMTEHAVELIQRMQPKCTPWVRKTCYVVFDYNFGVSRAIFTSFPPMET